MYDHTVGMQLSYLHRIESRPSVTGISGAILQCAEPVLVYNPARKSSFLCQQPDMCETPQTVASVLPS